MPWDLPFELRRFQRKILAPPLEFRSDTREASGRNEYITAWLVRLHSLSRIRGGGNGAYHVAFMGFNTKGQS